MELSAQATAGTRVLPGRKLGQMCFLNFGALAQAQLWRPLLAGLIPGSPSMADAAKELPWLALPPKSLGAHAANVKDPDHCHGVTPSKVWRSLASCAKRHRSAGRHPDAPALRICETYTGYRLSLSSSWHQIFRANVRPA